MKQVNLVINVVLILAVGVLFFLHFTGGEKPVESRKETTAKMVSDTTGAKIAYVQIDSVLSQMKMYEDVKAKLEKKQQQVEANFTAKAKAFEKEIADYQNKIQKGLVTRSEAQSLEQQLQAKNAQLESQRNDYLMELQEENMVSQNKIIDYIMNYLEEYTVDKNYNYILSYSFGGGILYASDRLDITNEVIEGLNEKYEKENLEE